MNSQAPVRDWHVWQKSRTGRAKNWAGQKPVPGNGPVVGNKQSQKGKTWQGLWQAVAVKVRVQEVGVEWGYISASDRDQTTFFVLPRVPQCLKKISGQENQ